MKSEDLSKLVVLGMQDKKASNIVVLDLSEIKNSVADYFVVCSANSDTQADAIADAIEAFVHKASKEKPWQKEGKNNKEWMLIDFVSVVAHIFKKEKRTHYNLEDLWGDAKVTEIAEI